MYVCVYIYIYIYIYVYTYICAAVGILYATVGTFVSDRRYFLQKEHLFFAMTDDYFCEKWRRASDFWYVTRACVKHTHVRHTQLI